MLNHIDIMGRLVRDPELRYTQSNTPVTSFTIAVDRDFKSESGEKQTDFIDCVAWRSTAEHINRYFTKGRMIVVSGRLQVREWVDKNENKRRNAEVVVDNVYFGEGRRDAESHTAPSSAPDKFDFGPGRSADTPSPFEDLEDDGELPF